MSARVTGAPAGVESFAVMADDSVLCAECVHEAVGDGSSASAGSVVHAWIDAGPGVCCGWCGEAAQLDGREG
jgi:hypothetical protein